MRWRTFILGVLVAMFCAGSFAQVACSARTPEQALPSGFVATVDESASDSAADFYRLARIVVDPQLHRRWALIANCMHPERPLQIVAFSSGHVVVPTVVTQPVALTPSIRKVARRGIQNEVAHHPEISSLPIVSTPAADTPVARSTPDPFAMVPLVNAGDLVRLWHSDGNVRLEMAVVSLEYGRVGQIIHLRRLGQSTLLAGLVVGKDSAELIP
jgi:hypothetical protein